MIQKILIVDFGVSVTQVVGRKIRELGVYCEIEPYHNFSIDDSVKGVVVCGSLSEDIKTRGIEDLIGRLPLLIYLESYEEDLANISAFSKSGVEFLNEKLTNNRFCVKNGTKILDDFLSRCDIEKDWTPSKFISFTVEKLRETIGDDKVILGLSGGVDSSVTAALLNKAIGDNLFAIFVNHGLLRKNEYERVLENYLSQGLNVKGIDAKDYFYDRLKGVEDPEQKRKIIGKSFIEVFEKEASKIKGAKWLAQGTIYPDVIESISTTGLTIKSHHNVGGLPEKMHLKLCEPLRMLFKDEVRKVGLELGLPHDFIFRHPFPGPGLGIRILGAITAEKVEIIQNADDIFISKLRESDLYDKVWQAAAILLPLRSVGVKNGKRTYEYTVALRAVNSIDAMTAEWTHLSYDFLEDVSNAILHEVEGVNRVVYDISSKPPATIEWE